MIDKIIRNIDVLGKVLMVALLVALLIGCAAAAFMYMMDSAISADSGTGVYTNYSSSIPAPTCYVSTSGHVCGDTYAGDIDN